MPAAPLPRKSKPAPPAPSLPTGRIFVLLALCLGVGLVVGLVPRMRHRAAVAAETRELATPTVTLVSPSPTKAGEPITLSGELKPLIDAPILARASGYVRRWLVDIGAHVDAGQLMAELDTPEIDRELTEAKADLKQAEAAQALANTTAKRWVQMLNGRTVSPQETEEKTGDYSVKQAAVESAAAKVERLEELTGFAKITAPFNGTVTARNLDIGQLVEAGSGRELFRVAQTDKLRVFVRVPQSYSRAVEVGQKAQLVLPEIPGRVFEAKVVRTAGSIDATSRTLLTELEVDNSKNELLPGSYAQVRLAEAHPDASLTIPSNCLLFRAEGPQAVIVGADNKVELRKVTIGRDFGMTLEILQGVSLTDRVVLNPPDAIVSGIEVRVSAASTPAAAAK